MRCIGSWKVPVIVGLYVLMAGCGSAGGGSVDYRSSRTLPPLEVPPDLDAVAASQSTAVPAAPGGGDVAAVPGYQPPVSGALPQSSAGRESVLPTTDNARIERSGSQRWLVVQGEPSEVWPRVRDFFVANGLILVVENPVTGIMETDWAENYANVGNALQMAMRKYLGSLFSTGTRDKFRARLERGMEPGTTEVYLTHRSMVEMVMTDRNNNIDPKQTVWEPQPADPGLEAEMLRLLMVHLGVEEERADALMAQSETQSRATVRRSGDGVPMLEVEEEFGRAWQRLGLSLDRIGVTVEDRNRDQGIYFVSYADPEISQKKGFFSRVFKGKKSAGPTQYQVKLVPSGSASVVTVHDKDGKPEASPTGERILNLLQEQLR